MSDRMPLQATLGFPERPSPGIRPLRSLVTAMALILPALALAAGTPATTDAQGYDTPTMIVTAFTCPDDIAYGDSLADTCRSPRSGTEISVDGPVSSSATTENNGRVIIEWLEIGTYTVSDPSLGSDRISLVSCHASEGFGGYRNLAVTYVDVGSFTVALTNQSGKVGTSDSCAWYDLPASNLDSKPAGLSVISSVSTDGSLTGFTVIPPDGTAPPISGAGPATPSSTILDLSLTGDALDGPLALTTSEPDTSSALSTSAVGPVLVPAGDYTMRDTTNGFDTDLTLDAGAFTDVASIAHQDQGSAPASPSGASLQFPGTVLAGTWTDLVIADYGDEAGALYGADSGYDAGTLSFDATDFRQDAPTTIALLGLDDELPASTQISVNLNGTEIYHGDSTFPAWDPDATGNQWGELTIDVDPGVLANGGNTNELVITDLTPGSSVGAPPWVMITLITIAQ